VYLIILIYKYFYLILYVNLCLSFTVTFLMVFIPFIFIMYIEPLLNITQLENPNGNPVPVTTFEQLLVAGTLTYGVSYSLCVGLNGMFFAPVGVVLLLVCRER